ncbi:MAG: spinster family MFS transporter [Pseudomonadales bacterium]
MNQPNTTDSKPASNAYAHYVLCVLVLVYVFNFVDRNVLSILAEDIKADLGISDAQMGFLYGTVFAVFYSVFGIPLARLADVWTRRTLISLGLAFWSLMTALSGTAKSFTPLALYRIGVGIGEASASPAAYSMLSDYYHPRLRATVIAIYSSGVYIGGGLGLIIGGVVLDAWATAYPVDPPMGLKGWQIAFFAVGIPGILLALWVRTLREPVRGQSEGLATVAQPDPLALLGKEMAAVLPPLTLYSVRKHGGSIPMNLLAAAGIALVAYGLILLTGSTVQWIALGTGAYITFSWAQSLKGRDPATFQMMFKSRALIYTTLAFPTIAFVTYGASFWTVPYLIRTFEVSNADVGLYVGIGNALGGLIGVTAGGVLADYLKTRTPNGRLYIGFITIVFTVPGLLAMLYTDSLVFAFIMNFVYHIPAAMWVGIPSATATDLVMPRMRAVATAYFLLMNTFIGLALGPYLIGRISDGMMQTGMNDSDALRAAIAIALLIFGLTLVFLLLAMRNLPKEEAGRLERAAQLGETVQLIDAEQPPR